MQVILADDQAIFRAGIARILMTEPAIHLCAQCSTMEQLKESIASLPRSIVLFSAGISDALSPLLDLIQGVGSRAVMILEADASPEEAVRGRLDGAILRSIASQQLIECLYRVDAGGRFTQRALLKTMPLSDRACSNILRRLTPKELQVVALISEGCKNKEIATKLGTKEQVIKNYLRSIYGKIGVSDRLELALFTIRHQVLSEVVQATRLALARSAQA
ncbi:MAG: response regulator transcription factor [Acidobacteria bacterium]|nr:response regulator transcription factor [Acidobacteriota bacterium]